MVITLDTRVEVPKDVLFRELAGEAILLNLVTGKYYGLDSIGTRMWSLLTQCGQVSTACCKLLEEYDVAAEKLEQDLLNLTERLIAQKLLKIDEA